MLWYHFVAYFFGGAFLSNTLPHLINGISGSSFQSPFASPPGKGLSSSTVNVLWGFFNLAVAYVLVCRVGCFSLYNNLARGCFRHGLSCHVADVGPHVRPLPRRGVSHTFERRLLLPPTVAVYSLPMQGTDRFMFTLEKLLDNATALTILLAFAGYLVTFLSARMLARRKDKLELVNRRLNEFYGPLYIALKAGDTAYRSLLKKQGKTQSFPILDSEMKEWMLWMTTIFMPLNDIREKIIIEKAYLIVEEQMPKCLLDFVTHVVGYKAVLAKWAEGDYSERRSTIGWPPEFDILCGALLCGAQSQADRTAA